MSNPSEIFQIVLRKSNIPYKNIPSEGPDLILPQDGASKDEIEAFNIAKNVDLPAAIAADKMAQVIKLEGVEVDDIRFRADPDGSDWLYYDSIMNQIKSEEDFYLQNNNDPDFQPRTIEVKTIVGSHVFESRQEAIRTITKLGKVCHQLWEKYK